MTLVDIALSQYGVREVQGPEDHSPDVLKYFVEIGHGWNKNDELAWCSAFMNWVAMKAGCEYTGLLNARSWLEVGESIGRHGVKLGDVVILWRKEYDSPWGHVGLYINEDPDSIYILGGNQGNMVCIKQYPKKRLLGYRRLKAL
jgi:uncharacterized protein (TIGR02594 family)